MKKNENLRRLLLNRETIRSLEDRKLLEVVGGVVIQQLNTSQTNADHC